MSDPKKIIRGLRRDAVAQAIADMLVRDYHTQAKDGMFTDTYIFTGDPEFLELVTNIRKVMDQIYAQA